MDQFKQELNKLLEKYPDIGEFTIHVQPRIKITSFAPVTSSALKPEAIKAATEPGAVAEVPKVALEGVLAMESAVKSKIAGMKKATAE